MIALAAAGLFGTAGADDAADARARFGLPSPSAPTSTSAAAAPSPRAQFGLPTPARAPATCADAALVPCPRRDGDAPAAVAPVITRAYLRRLPLADADLGAAAGLVAGAGRDDAGTFFGGATGVDTRYAVDGAPIDAPFTGGLGLTVPIDFLASLRIGVAGLGVASGVGVGGQVDGELRAGGATHQAEARAWLGAGATPAWLGRGRGAYVPFRGRYAAYRAAAAVAVVDGPGPHVADAATWYVLGAAPRLSDAGLVRDGFRQVDDDGDGVPDHTGVGQVTHALLASTARPALAYDVPFLARAGLRTTHHQLAVTALGEAARTTRWLTVAEASAAGVDRATVAGTAIATWRATWDHTSLVLGAAWYRSQRTDAPHAVGGDAPAIGFAYVPGVADDVAGDDRLVRAGCTDGGDDPAPRLANCPLAAGYYWTGGAGRLVDLTIDRPSVHFDVVDQRGDHRLALGVRGDDVRAAVTERYTGATLRQQLGDGLFIDYRLVELGAGDRTCAGQACRYLDRATTTYRTRTVAAYLADTWRPAPVVAVEYGARLQRSQLGTAVITDDVQPRASGAWDFLGGGRSRAFVGWGRYVDALVAGTGDVIYAGPTVLQTLTVGPDASEALGGRAGEAVAAAGHGTRVDEVLAGVEVGWPDVARLGVLARDRRLGRALDDQRGELTVVGSTAGPAATRGFQEVAAWIDGAPTAKLGARLGYAWSRLRGNWPGPYDPVEGYQLGGSSSFDGGDDPAGANATGRLPGDQPHRLFAELSLRGRWRGFAVDGSVRAVAASGRPRSARIGTGQVFAVPRGSIGRLPTTSQANLHLAARRGRLQATLDVFNLFDQRGVLAVDEQFARDATPIVGGQEADLVWLKDDVVDGAPALRNRSYGVATRVQAPIAIVVGVALTL
ncbi:MAG: hypothetical protein R3B06_22995 [Kofleriaceae bacterium]